MTAKFGKRQVYRMEQAWRFANNTTWSMDKALDEEQDEENRINHVYCARANLRKALLWLDKTIVYMEMAEAREGEE